MTKELMDKQSDKTAMARSDRGLFAVGNKGGPGRGNSPNKATRELKQAAQAHTETALQTLVEIATDAGAPTAARVSACAHILDRGHGKPKQSVEVEGNETNVDQSATLAVLVANLDAMAGGKAVSDV